MYFSNKTTLNYSGEYHYGLTSDATTKDGDLINLYSDNIWYPTDQTSISSSLLLGICTNDAGIPNKTGVLTEGNITVTTASGYPGIPFISGSTFYGQPVYMTGSAGYTADKPTSGYVRVIGHMYYNNPTNTDFWIMKFRPSNDWYQI